MQLLDNPVSDNVIRVWENLPYTSVTIHHTSYNKETILDKKTRWWKRNVIGRRAGFRLAVVAGNKTRSYWKLHSFGERCTLTLCDCVCVIWCREGFSAWVCLSVVVPTNLSPQSKYLSHLTSWLVLTRAVWRLKLSFWVRIRLRLELG